jgi:hypothetical protein
MSDPNREGLPRMGRTVSRPQVALQVRIAYAEEESGGLHNAIQKREPDFLMDLPVSEEKVPYRANPGSPLRPERHSPWRKYGWTIVCKSEMILQEILGCSNYRRSSMQETFTAFRAREF